MSNFQLFFLIRIVGVESKLGPLGTSATEWPIVPATGDYDDGEFGGMKIGRGNRSTRRKPAPAPLCPLQIPRDQTRVWTRAPAVGSQRLTAWAMARPNFQHNISRKFYLFTLPNQLRDCDSTTLFVWFRFAQLHTQPVFSSHFFLVLILFYTWTTTRLTSRQSENAQLCFISHRF
jgi:hypothetical protein